MKCPNCGTMYEGSRCPDCGRHTDPRDEARQRNRKFILITAGIIVVIAIFTVGIYIKLDNEANKVIDEAISELDAIQQPKEETQPVNSVSSTKTEDVDQPEIVSSINDYLDDSWGGETSAKMNGDGLSIVLCAAGEIPDFLDAAQAVASSVMNLAAEADVSTCVVTVKQSLDSSAQILLTFINGKLAYRADENIETDSAPESTIPVRDTANETVSQKNAVEKAISYISLMPFSHEGLIEQLEYEKFSYADAAYGATYCGADWYEQAVLAAASYLDLMSFSHDGLVEQLEYAGFTHDQAVYGVEENGLY